MKPPYGEIVAALALLDRLAPFRPVLIGTPPLGIDVAGSDIDVACCADDLAAFARAVEDHFGDRDGFCVEHLHELPETSLRVAFTACGWDVELFCQATPTERQSGVRHFEIERRLLELAPELGPAVIELKAAGLKTEPAFARLLGLPGDPYQALLDLETSSDAELRTLLATALPP